jgi:thymidylate synthase (FAD)
MGTDLDVVNSARVSFDKEVDELSEKDSNLISFLVREKHDACFRHCVMTFEVYAPLMVARQWYKHAVASTHLDDQLGWNESSRRYITEKEEFYIPGVDQWRSAPDNKKQGSGDSIGMYKGAKYYQIMIRNVTEAHKYYLEALEDGVAPEQARLLLPAYAMYVRWRWTVSLNGVMNFLNLRLDSHAQWEIQQYAKAVEEYVKEFYPVTYEAWVKHRSI